MNRKVGIRVLAVLMSLAMLAAPALAQAPAAKQKPAAVKPTAAQAKVEPARPGAHAAKPPGGPQEGIKVHGHWTIIVREADGKEVSRQEFENAVTDSGKSLLALLLAQQIAVGGWQVEFAGSGGPCTVPTGLQPAPCTLSQPALRVSFVQGGAPTGDNPFGPSGTVRFQGDTRVQFNSNITTVDTKMQVGIAGFFSFTHKTLDTAIGVTAEQIVEVIVTLSFS